VNKLLKADLWLLAKLDRLFAYGARYFKPAGRRRARGASTMQRIEASRA
jgi:hypothetical protein